jgi:putative membrane protein
MLISFAHAGLADTVANNEMFGHMMDGHYFAEESGYSFIWMLLFMLLVVLIVFALLSYTFKPGKNDGSALDEAKRRYAKGEIDKKEFDQLKKDLR